MKMEPSKLSLQIPALVLMILGFITMWAALATPSWQTVYARELRQWVQSGLWLNCQTRPSGMYTCTYTFSDSDFDFYTSAEVVNYRTPAFYQWQRTLLHILLGVQFTAFVALVCFCVSNSPAGERCAVVGFVVAAAISAFVSLACMLAFAVFSHMVEYRFYHVSVSGIYEKHRGYSFYLGLTAGLLYLLSLCFAVVYAFKVFTKDRFANAGSLGTINAYRPPEDFFSPPGRDSRQMNYRYSEDSFAMRDLPDVPQKYRR